MNSSCWRHLPIRLLSRISSCTDEAERRTARSESWLVILSGGEMVCARSLVRLWLKSMKRRCTSERQRCSWRLFGTEGHTRSSSTNLTARRGLRVSLMCARECCDGCSKKEITCFEEPETPEIGLRHHRTYLLVKEQNDV